LTEVAALTRYPKIVQKARLGMASYAHFVYLSNDSEGYRTRRNAEWISARIMQGFSGLERNFLSKYAAKELVSQYLLFRLAWNQALATPAAPEIPMLDKVGDYFVNVSYLNSARVMNLNFGDGGLTADTTSPLVWLRANGYSKSSHLWYLYQNKPEQHHRDSDRTSAMGLVFYPGDAELATSPVAPDLPPSALYVSPSATTSSGVGKAGESDGDERPESRTRRRAERGGAGGCAK